MHRRLIIIRGERPSCLITARALTRNIETLETAQITNVTQVLGREYDAVICDLHEGFSRFSTNQLAKNRAQTAINPNTFGAIAGVIRGGGALLLLLPDDTKTLQKSRFFRRFLSLLRGCSTSHCIQAGEIPLPLPQPERVSQRIALSYGCITADQVAAVTGILKVVEGHRRRPLLISSDRGRGKSAALGLAAAQLLNKGCKQILVCAPSRKAASVVFELAASSLKNRDDIDRLEFIAPDKLLRTRPTASLLMIDEAAAMPLKMLKSVLDAYARVVFATTLHGYEGSGRGFATRFSQLLDESSPAWKHCELLEPVRWSTGDPLEQFVFDALLLATEPAVLDAEPNGSFPENVIAGENKSLAIIDSEELQQSQLAQDEQTLRELFGLLVDAHYQTRPSDLQYLLDDESVRLFVLREQGRVVAAVLLAREGGFDGNMAQAVFAGRRRLTGHLVAQALAAGAGLPEGPCLIGERIVRIAVHSLRQRQGLGSRLIAEVLKHADTDYISTSFGATAGLLSFWKQCGFSAVHLGVRRDSSSGCHSVIMLALPGLLSARSSPAFFNELQSRFIQSLPYLLGDTLTDLETDVAMALLTDLPQSKQNDDFTLMLTSNEWREVSAFAKEQRAYENSVLAIWKLTCLGLPALGTATVEMPFVQQQILVKKVLQKKTWSAVIGSLEMSVDGKKAALILLRCAVETLLDHFSTKSNQN